jgi:hypothetical protein
VLLIAAAVVVVPIAFSVKRVPNDPPVGVDDRFVVREGTRLVVDAPGLLVNDFDPDGDPIASALDTDPAHGTILAATVDGSFVYEPDRGYVGADSFAYAVRDDLGGATGAVADVKITVIEATNPTSGPSVPAGATRRSTRTGLPASVPVPTSSSATSTGPLAGTGTTSNPLIPAALLGAGLLIIAYGVRRARNDVAAARTQAAASDPLPPTWSRCDPLEEIVVGDERDEAAAATGTRRSESAGRMRCAGDVDPGVLDGVAEVIEQVSLMGQPVDGAHRLADPSMVERGEHSVA